MVLMNKSMEEKIKKTLNDHGNPIGTSWLTKCPVCKSGQLIETIRKKIFGLLTIKSFECNKCDAIFARRGEKHKLSKVQDASSLIWQEYRNQTLTAREWKNIANGGMSDVKQKEADMEEWMNAIREGKAPIKFIGIPSPILLKKDEELRCVLPNISLKEPRSVRVSSGGYGGPSFRVAKGVYFRVGAFGSKSESREEIRVIDKGMFTLTNKRIVFTGQKRTLSVNLDKIISIDSYSDGIALRRERKQKTQYFIWSEKLAKLTVTIDDRKYEEPFSGLILKYMIEGLREKAG